MADPFRSFAEGTAADAKGPVLDSLHGVAPTDSNSPTGRRADLLMALRRENQRLREAAGDAVVEQAKGALMLRYGIDAYQAHGVPRGWAQDYSIDEHVLADTLVNVVCTGAERGPAVEPAVLRRIEERLRHNPDADGHTARASERRRR